MRIVSLAACFCAAFVLQSPVSAQAPTVVRIGILNDQSGPYADFGGKDTLCHRCADGRRGLWGKGARTAGGDRGRRSPNKTASPAGIRASLGSPSKM